MANLAKTAGKMENTQEVREEEFSEKETQGQLLTVESDFIAGMLARPLIKTMSSGRLTSFVMKSCISPSGFMRSEKKRRTNAARSIRST